jgi:hypothetical protein
VSVLIPVENAHAVAAPEVRQLVIRRADCHAGRTGANVQSDLQMLLAAGPLDLGEDKLEDIILESPTVSVISGSLTRGRTRHAVHMPPAETPATLAVSANVSLGMQVR